MMKNSQGEDSIPFLQPEDNSNDDDNTDEEHTSRHRPPARFNRIYWLFGVITVLLVTHTVALFVGSQLYVWRKNLDRICAIHTSQHENTVLRDVEVSYSPVLFNGSFTKETIYRQRPSPEVDAAWLDLGIEYDPMIIPDEDAEAAGIEKDRFHVSERYGGPGYPAFVTGLHQLHCLNLLRKSLYFNVDYYQNLNQAEWLNDQETLFMHIGHCLDAIRQRLMCTADTELTPYVWVGDPPHVTPDFNRVYKCRNYDDIREYARQRQAQWGPMGPDVVPEEGSLVLDEIP